MVEYLIYTLAYLFLGLVLVGTEIRWGFPCAMIYSVLTERSFCPLALGITFLERDSEMHKKIFYIFLYPLAVMLNLIAVMCFWAKIIAQTIIKVVPKFFEFFFNGLKSA